MRTTKILASILAISTVACTAGNSVLAYDFPIPEEISVLEQNDTSLRYTYISSFTPAITSSGSIRVNISLYERYDYSVTLELEQYIGGSWESIDSWYLDGNYRGAISESCSLESGERYRARAYVDVYDDYGDIVESTTKYSAAVTAR